MQRRTSWLITDAVGWLNRAVWLAWAVLVVAHLSTLGSVPAGLYYDEAFNALDAFRIGRAGFWPVFLSGNFGREPLMHYIMAAGLRLFRHAVWVVRLPAAMAWAGSLPALYWLLAELYPADRQGRNVRWFIAAPLFMTSLWFGVLAHFAVRISWFVLLELLFLAALWRVWRTGSGRSALLAGLFGGLVFYTYLPNRLLPVLLGLLAAAALVWRRDDLLARWRPFALVAVVALVVQLPLLIHFARSPQDFYLRLSQVALLTGDHATAASSGMDRLVGNAAATAGMFFHQGDANPRVNVPGRSVLTWWVFPLFLAGLYTALRPRPRPAGGRRLFLLLWLLVMLLPTALSENAPDFMRAIGAFPPSVLLLAEGSATFWRWSQVTRLGRDRRGLRTLVALGLAAVVMMDSLISLSAWVRWTRMPALFYAFDEGITQIGQYIARQPADRQIYLTPIRDHATLTYLLAVADNPPTVLPFDGRHILVTRPGQDITYLVVVHEDYRFELMAPWLYPQEELDWGQAFYDREGNPYARILTLAGAARVRAPQFSVDERWADGIHLAGYELISCCSYPPGSTVYLDLWWQVGATPPHQTWTVFTHLLAPDGHMVAGDDAQPGRGSYPTTRWQPGDLLVDEYQLHIPEDAQPGEYTLELGLYDWQDGGRLPLADGTGDHVTLRSITVQLPGP